MPDVPYTRRLVQFAKLENSPSVMVQQEGVIVIDGQVITRFPLQDLYPDDAVLGTRAVTEGKDIWDEDTVCAELGLVRGWWPGDPPPWLADIPAEPPAEEPEPPNEEPPAEEPPVEEPPAEEPPAEEPTP